MSSKLGVNQSVADHIFVVPPFFPAGSCTNEAQEEDELND
jgi:hypothetical protein